MFVTLNACVIDVLLACLCWTSITLHRMEENPDSDRRYLRTTDDPSPSDQGTRQQSEEESPLGDHDLPIMQWEDLSLRIAELERQEEERRKKAEVTSCIHCKTHLPYFVINECFQFISAFRLLHRILISVQSTLINSTKINKVIILTIVLVSNDILTGFVV